MKMWKVILLFVTLCFKESQVFAYKAAVVEYAPTTIGSPQNIIRKNIERYVLETDSAYQENADIIVFPEYGLTGLAEQPANFSIEIPNGNTTSTDEFSAEVLLRLANIAIEHNIYLVVNLLEKSSNGNKVNYHNTNIVFNRKGKLIARYRKMNFCGAYLTPGTEMATFTTDFGVTFGIVICADVLYPTPARRILDQINVTDVVFPQAWCSLMPFQVSNSIQHGYAQSTGLNVLAANLNLPKEGGGGSGIYLGDGTIAEYYVSARPGTKLIIQEVPKHSRRANLDCTPAPKSSVPNVQGEFPDDSDIDISAFFTYKDFSPSRYVFSPLDLQVKEVNKTICHNEFCCNFEIQIATQNASDHYQLVVFNGKAQVGETKENVNFCSVLACPSADVNSCGGRVNVSTTSFGFVRVTTSVPSSNFSYLQPCTLNTELSSLQTSYCQRRDSLVTHELRTRTSIDHVLVFGFYGFSSDGHMISYTSFFSFITFLLIVKSILN